MVNFKRTGLMEEESQLVQWLMDLHTVQDDLINQSTTKLLVFINWPVVGSQLTITKFQYISLNFC